MIARPGRVPAWLGRHRSLLLLAAALGLGTLAAFGARGYIAGQLAIERDRLAPPQRMVSVVVAKRDLARGETVGPDTMAVRELPEAWAPQGAVTPEQFDAVAGSVVGVAMRAGEPLLHAAVSSPESAGLSSRVREGIRAMTISVDEVNAISGMLQPGDRIDLMLSARLPPGGPAGSQEVSRPLLQDVVVLATGRQIRPGQDDRQARAYTTITVEVRPEQAQRLVVAQRVGRLTALLRNPGDRERLPPKPMDVYGLLGLPPPGAPEARRPTELIVGGVGGLRAGVAASVPVAHSALAGPPAIPGGPPPSSAAPSSSTAPSSTTAILPGAAIAPSAAPSAGATPDPRTAIRAIERTSE